MTKYSRNTQSCPAASGWLYLNDDILIDVYVQFILHKSALGSTNVHIHSPTTIQQPPRYSTMSLPAQHKPFTSDLFGIFPTQLLVIPPAKTQGQSSIEHAWKEVRNFAGLLNEYTHAIERRGLFSDDAIRWYVKDYERADLWEDIQKAYVELGDRLTLLNEAMVETAKLRRLDRSEQRGRQSGNTENVG